MDIYSVASIHIITPARQLKFAAESEERYYFYKVVYRAEDEASYRVTTRRCVICPTFENKKGIVAVASKLMPYCMGFRRL